MRSPEEVAAAAERFEHAGLRIPGSLQHELCCHAVQDKVTQPTTPDVPLGHWEYYTIVDDDPAEAIANDAAQCCQTDGEDSNCCATDGTISTPSAA